MNRTALITGASSGIGLELAHIHASKGDNLVLVARRKDKLDVFKLELEKKFGVTVYNIGKDLTEKNAAHDVYNELKQKKIQIDYLINNAGFGDYGLFADSDWDKQEQMIQLNIGSLTHMTHLFLPNMIKQKYGRILNIASTAAFQPGPSMSVYFATKAYVLSFSEAISHELKGTGVTVTALCPGPTKSGFESAAALDKSTLFKSGKIASSSEVAKFGHKHMMNKKGLVIHGFINNIMVTTVRFIPRKLVTYITYLKLNPKK